VSECNREASIMRRPCPLAFWECGHGCLSLVSVVCYQVGVSPMGRSFFQNIPTQCGESESNGREETELERVMLVVFPDDP